MPHPLNACALTLPIRARAGALLMVCVAIACAGEDAGIPTRAFVHSLFHDHMLLQRGRAVPVWGWATPGTKVTVAIAGAHVSAAADANGRWQVALPAMTAGGPHRMTISGPRTLTIEDVLVGDVWVCSGQSNMQGNLDRTNNGSAIANANVPAIRFLSAIPGNDNGTEVPLDDFAVTRGTWQVCSPASADKLSRTAYFFGRDLHDHLKVPIGLIVVALNGSPIESWTPRPALMSLPAYENDDRFYAADDVFGEIIPHWHLPCTRFNSLIHPLAPYGIKGFLWYQGETNSAWRHPNDRYADLLALMIRGWRACWRDDTLPFITIQLPSTPKHKDLREVPGRNSWAEIQDAQARSLRLPHTGVAITMDLGDGDLHPKTKDRIGARAALAARQVAYGEAITGMGPTFTTMRRDGAMVRVAFANRGGGLASLDQEPLRFFLIAGGDRRFVWADARIDGDDVLVSHAQVPEPVAVRYGWQKDGLVNFGNRDGIPASPFRTDTWEETGERTPRLRGPSGKGIPWDGTVSVFPAAPLLLVAQQGRGEQVAAFARANPQAIAAWNQQRFNLLNAVIVAGHTTVAQQLIELGIDATIPEGSGLFPLHRAALHGRLELARVLIEQGAPVDQPTRNPGLATPLFFAAQSDAVEIVRLLLDRGAPIDLGRQFYRAGSGIETHTPLRAAFEKTADGATACLLLERGCALEARFPSGDGLLLNAVRRPLPRVVALLLTRGISVDETNQKKETALEIASGAGNRELVELLLKHGAKANERTFAAARQRADHQAITSLLEAGAK